MDPEKKLDKVDKMSLPELQSQNLEDKEEKQWKDQDTLPSLQSKQEVETHKTGTPTLESALGFESEDLQEKHSQEPDLHKLYEEIDKLDETQLPPELRSLNLDQLKEHYDKADLMKAAKLLMPQCTSKPQELLHTEHS